MQYRAYAYWSFLSYYIILVFDSGTYQNNFFMFFYWLIHLKLFNQNVKIEKYN